MVARLLDCDETIGEGLVVLAPDLSPDGTIQVAAKGGAVWARRVVALCARVIGAGGVVVSMPVAGLAYSPGGLCGGWSGCGGLPW